MQLNDAERQALATLFKGDHARALCDKVEAELSQTALSKGRSEEDRQQALHMLWAFQHLMVKIRAGRKVDDKDSAP